MQIHFLFREYFKWSFIWIYINSRELVFWNRIVKSKWAKCNHLSMGVSSTSKSKTFMTFLNLKFLSGFENFLWLADYENIYT